MQVLSHVLFIVSFNVSLPALLATSNLLHIFLGHVSFMSDSKEVYCVSTVQVQHHTMAVAFSK